MAILKHIRLLKLSSNALKLQFISEASPFYFPCQIYPFHPNTLIFFTPSSQSLPHAMLNVFYPINKENLKLTGQKYVKVIVWGVHYLSILLTHDFIDSWKWILHIFTWKGNSMNLNQGTGALTHRRTRNYKISSASPAGRQCFISTAKTVSLPLR